MTEKRLIGIVGGTSGQGLSLAMALLLLARFTGLFKVRIITRNTKSKKAFELAAMGAEIVYGDVLEYSSLARAFAGCWGVFCNSFFWADMSTENELKALKNQAGAAKAVGVKRVVLSTLEDTRTLVDVAQLSLPMLGQYLVDHFDAKADGAKEFEGLHVTYVRVAFYLNNLYNFHMMTRDKEGDGFTVCVPIGDSQMPVIAVEDVGPAVAAIFAVEGEEYSGQTIGLTSGYFSEQDLADLASSALSISAKPSGVTPEQYDTFGFPGCHELARMALVHKLAEKYFITEGRSVDATLKLNPDMPTPAQRLQEHRADFGLPLLASAAAVPLETPVAAS